MKKYIALLLLTAAVLSACSSAPESAEETTAETESAPVTETAVPETEAETEAQTEAPKPENVEVFEYHTLELAKDPEFKDGVLLLYFTENDVWFEPDASFYIGLRSEDEAYSISASSETEQYPDMMVEDEYCGIALRPAEEIPAGEYRMSVTFEEYICDFELAIQ